MTAFSAYFNGNTVYINGKKKYVLGEILEKILDKRYRELDKLYSECRRYEAILHYPEDMREADESEELFQGAISFYDKIEQMIANTSPYSAMDIQRDTLRTILNEHIWAFDEDELGDDDELNEDNIEEHYHFYVRIGSGDMEDSELLRDIYILNDQLKAFASEMRIFIEDILRVKRTFEPFLEKIHSESRYLDNNETAQVLADFNDIRLGITTWKDALNALEQVALSNAVNCVPDIKQLQGYCEQLDSEAFIPFNAEDFGINVAMKAERPFRLLDALVEALKNEPQHEVSLKNLMASPFWSGYRRYIRIDGFCVNLEYDTNKWKKSDNKNTPFWISINKEINKKWCQDDQCKKAMLKIPSDLKDDTYIALLPKCYVALSEVAEDMKKQVLRYIQIFKET